jgi:C1A family cysteine protease
MLRHLLAAAFLFSAGTAAADIVKKNGYDVIVVPAQKDAHGLVVIPTKEYHTGLRAAKEAMKGASVVDFTADPACANLPENFDLLTDVKPSPVSDVRDQGQCGSCWSFSETGAMESYARVTGVGDFNLSEQELVSNDSANYGCGGGNLSSYQRVNGQGLEADFPYRAADVARKTIPAVLKASAWEVVGGSGAAKELGMKCSIFKYHTVPWITVGADNDWGSPPSGDGAVWTRCSNNGTNHAIGYTGWKTVNGKVYFHAKNSWGTSWGQAGFAWIPLGCDGFGEEVAFMPAAIVPPPPPPPPPVKWTCTAKSGFIFTHSYTGVSKVDEANAARDAFNACKIADGWFCRAAGCVQGI